MKGYSLIRCNSCGIDLAWIGSPELAKIVLFCNSCFMERD